VDLLIFGTLIFCGNVAMCESVWYLYFVTLEKLWNSYFGIWKFVCSMRNDGIWFVFFFVDNCYVKHTNWQDSNIFVCFRQFFFFGILEEARSNASNKKKD
jgi:hypothetical protein